VREGRDPVQARKIERAEATTASDRTFAQVAGAWLEKDRKGRSVIH
jgi:hypothetical protein